MKKMILAIFTSCLSLMAYANIEKSSLAASSTAKIQIDSQKYTAKDYIQDGLIVQLDGIENAGWGMHGTDPNYWMELQRSILFNQFTSAGYVAVGDNCMYGGRWAIPTSYYVDVLNCFSNSCTYEIAISYGQTGQFATGGIMYFGSQDICMSVNKNDIAMRFLTSVWQFSPKYMNYKMQVITATICANASTSMFYMDGQMFGQRQKDRLESIGLGRYPTVGHELANYAVRRYHSIRIYNRALSADEIKHNHKIDKARFNIQ